MDAAHKRAHAALRLRTMPPALFPPDHAPSHAYYRACEGSWTSPVSLLVTDGRALRRSGMSFANRVMLRMMASWPRWLGRLSMNTTVAYDAAGKVVHTTSVCWLNIPLQRSTETISLDPDGQRFEVRGGMEGTGEIDETGTVAEYRLRWFGVELRQRTTRAGDRVTVAQEGPGFRGAQTLMRHA